MPPTDPRWLAMTPELIELEFTHAYIDKLERESKKESFEDEAFEDYAEDAKDDDAVTEGSVSRTAEQKTASEDDAWMGEDPGDWEDVTE